MRFFRLLFILAVLVSAASCGGRDLFRDGKSEYSIVLAQDASESERYAAAELRHWIKEVSGVELPVTGLEEGEKGKRLIVGYNHLVEDLVPGSVRPEDRDDSFTLKSVGGDILLWGGALRGTLYSVYSFLEEELGCRWYSSKVSVAPKRNSWSFRKLYRHEAPGIIIRDNCVLDVRSNPAFSARMRNNFVRLPGIAPGETIPGTAEGYWGVHAMGYLVPSERFYSSHPEYFSLRDGKRLSSYAQLCLSNPEVLSICVERLKEVMRENPDFLVYSVEQNDNQLFCQCEEFTALAERYGGQSGLMVWFVNQVADAVKDEFPDKSVGTFAYQYTRHAPKDIVPRDNVVIRLCSIECCLLHDYDDCERNVDFLKDLRDWSAIAPHLYIWDYVTDFAQYSLPVANWKTIASHIKDFRDNHAIGILEEGDYQTISCELREMRSWILSKLMWNPDADVDALVKDFSDGYYGAAGKYIREYLDLEDRILRRPGIHANCYIIANDPMYTVEFISEGRKIFAEAKKAVAGDADLLQRVQVAEMPLLFLQVERNPVASFKDGTKEELMDVIAREGINQLAEGDWAGGVLNVDRLRARYIAIQESIDYVNKEYPASEVETSGQGIAYTKYEGSFMSTSEMLKTGKVTAKGTMPEIVVGEDPEKDHFGYVFDCWFMAVESGVHQFTVVSDDGAVLNVDGEKVLDIDGSHSVQSQIVFVNLEKGLHRLTLNYFEDCEGQVLSVSLSSPEGYFGPLPAERLFIPQDKK